MIRYNRVRKAPIKWYQALITVTIPVFVIALCMNVMTRLPDVYERYIESDSLSENGVYISGEELGQEISGFMLGRSDSIRTIDEDDDLYDYYKNFASDFSDEELAGLGVLRTADNIMAAAGIFCLIWSAIMFIYHIREGYEYKHNMRRLFLISLAVEAGILAALAAAAAQIRPGGLMSAILPDAFPLILTAYIAAGAAAVTGIIAYIIWFFTKPRDTFNERRYFR